MSLRTVELKAFVPAKDFELSKSFYRDFGFTMASDSHGVAYFHDENVSFLLQDFYAKELAENLMLHLLVINRRQNADYEPDSCNREKRFFKALERARSFAKSVVENTGQKHYRDCQDLWRELHEEQRTFPLLRRRMVSEQRGTDQEARSPLSTNAAHRTGRLRLGPQVRARRA